MTSKKNKIRRQNQNRFKDAVDSGKIILAEKSKKAEEPVKKQTPVNAIETAPIPIVKNKEGTLQFEESIMESEIEEGALEITEPVLPENHIISFPDNVSEECCKLFLNAELIRRK